MTCQRKRTLRVLFDAHMIGAQETGNETYAVNLLCALASLPGIICAAAVAPGATLPERLLRSNVELLPLRSSSNWDRLLYDLPAMGQRWSADVMHSTYIGPLRSPCARVTTVHDVVFKRYPTFFSPRDRLLFATLMPLTLRRADAVITISEFTKLELARYFPRLRSRVYVTLLASSDHLFQPICDSRRIDSIRTRYHIGSDFVLAVGNLQPRKNLVRLIEAFDIVRHQSPSLQLVIVGKAQWQSSEVHLAVTRSGLAKHVIFTDYVSDEDLAVLFNMAAVFVYPSLYEGFGLPVLEAMACGAPVVTSKVSSMPEVAGDAALLVDPTESRLIAEAILSVLTVPELSVNLSEKGLRRAREFSWHRTACDTVNVYRHALNQRRSAL